MSQEKVTRNKELKANRKKINQQKKMKHVLASVVAAVICVVIVGWIGYSVYGKTQSTAEDTGKTPIDITALSDYLTDLQPEE